MKGKYLLRKIFLSATLGLFAFPLAASPETGHEEWYGVYLRGVKIGFSHTSTVFLDSTVATTDRTVMVFSMLGTRDSVDTFVRAENGPEAALRSFEFRLSGRDTEFRVLGSAKDSTLHLEVDMAGETRFDTVVCSGPPQLPSTLPLLIRHEGLSSGKSISAQVFDPSALSVQPLEVTVGEQERIDLEGRQVNAWHIVQDMAGVRVDSWLDNNGRVLREESGMGYGIILQDSAGAVGGDWRNGTADIQELIAVIPDRPLPTPRQLRRLELELTGVDPDSLDLEGGGQSVNGVNLNIRVTGPGGAEQEYVTAAEQDQYLRPTRFIQSDHPRLLAVMAEASDSSASPEEKIRSLLAWMRHNITAKPTFSLPNTLEVLQSRQGDCNEFSVLFCSMARAAGIPTRIAMGLVYLDKAFYYHAWCECVLGGKWVTVDPVFGQFPADAAHVRLIAGDMDRQLEILPLIGNLGIKVLDYGVE